METLLRIFLSPNKKRNRNPFKKPVNNTPNFNNKLAKKNQELQTSITIYLQFGKVSKNVKIKLITNLNKDINPIQSFKINRVESFLSLC